MGAYEDALAEVWSVGHRRPDRTGTGTISTFGLRMEFDLQEGFPLITTKKVSFKTIAEELLWFLSGDTNVRSLQEKGVHIWDEWANKDGHLGPVYGAQWRNWWDCEPGDYPGKGTDQIANVIESIKNDPYSRRHIVSAWNVGDLPFMALAPCHILFQFYVTNDGRLDCQLYQRSADMFLGVPYNIASYSLLTHMIAAQTGLQPGRFIWTGGDCHIYNNHVDQVATQLTRKPYPYPSLLVRDGVKSIDDYTIDDFEIVNYKHHPVLKGKVAV